MYVPVGEQPAK